MISIDSWSVHLVPINPDIKRLLEERESQTLALFTTENGVSPSPSLLINLPLSKFCRVPVHSVSAKTDELELGAAGVISPVSVPPTTESQARHPHPLVIIGRPITLDHHLTLGTYPLQTPLEKEIIHSSIQLPLHSHLSALFN